MTIYKEQHYTSKQRSFAPEEQQDQIILPDQYFGLEGGKRRQVWYFDGTKAVRVGIANFDASSWVELGSDQSLRDALCAAFPNEEFVIHRMALPPGAYYRRMARPRDQNPREAPGDSPDCRDAPELIIDALNQVRALVGMLESIFQTVYPAENNMSCYGTGIRNLLILACTECEAQWRGVLAANGYEYSNRPTTSDYVKLLPAMRLSEYVVRLRHAPWSPEVAPFRDWNGGASTRSIAWYDDYNAAKHDRMSSFSRASLRSAIEAVAAVWIMIAAQYGHRGIREFADLDRYFDFVGWPLWRYSEVYTARYQGTDGTAGPQKYPFGDNGL